MENILGLYANIKMLEQEEMFRHFFCNLSKTRQQKIETVRADSARCRSLGAWTLMDYGLWKLYGLRERDVRIGYGAQGKPYIEDMPDIHFNLSHSGDAVLAVFAPVEVGCDIQQTLERTRNERITARFFSQEEQQAYASGMDFYRIWARKESYLKLTGQGMALDMRAFSVAEDVHADDGAVGTGTPEVSTPLVSRIYYADHTLPDYKLAICYASAKSLPVNWVQTDWTKLLNR